MKLSIIPINKLALLCAAVFALGMLAFSPNANALALTFSDHQVVGTTTPGAPASPQYVADYINYMIGLGLGQTVVHNFGSPEGTQTETRSNNVFASLPNADPTIISQGTSTTINLGVGGVYSYLFAKYDGQNDKSLVWYVGNLSGTITIPQNGPLGHGLSGWILFGPGGHVPAPDGGATVMLLGGALGALGMARRFLKR
jgi:hypothetical protein